MIEPNLTLGPEKDPKVFPDGKGLPSLSHVDLHLLVLDTPSVHLLVLATPSVYSTMLGHSVLVSLQKHCFLDCPAFLRSILRSQMFN